MTDDLKQWYVISCPVEGIRFDKRTLELLDADGDGHIRMDEVLAAIEYLEKNKDKVDDERVELYSKHLEEFLANYVTMERLYDGKGDAMFQTGVLRIDGREMNLCFNVSDEEAHAGLSGRSNCFVIYLKLTRPAVGEERNICAVVTAGTVAGLYVGRNGVFYDRDGHVWEATITRVVENQVSLIEAFWSPWRKLGELVTATVTKFLTTKRTEADAKLAAAITTAPAAPTTSNNGAALASGVAAVGIGLGMVGAAAASLMAAISRMTPIEVVVALVVLFLIVSLPSMILCWFKLRKRDIGAVLNASGWAINRRMGLTLKRAREFTKCASTGIEPLMVLSIVIFALAIFVGIWYYISQTTNC